MSNFWWQMQHFRFTISGRTTVQDADSQGWTHGYNKNYKSQDSSQSAETDCAGKATGSWMHQCLITTFKKRVFGLLRLHSDVEKKKSFYIFPRKISIKKEGGAGCSEILEGWWDWHIGRPLQECPSDGVFMASSSYLDTHAVQMLYNPSFNKPEDKQTYVC